MKPRFLLDEHINRAIQRQLRRQDLAIEILAIGDPGAPEAGTKDPALLNWIEETVTFWSRKIGTLCQSI